MWTMTILWPAATFLHSLCSVTKIEASSSSSMLISCTNPWNQFNALLLQFPLFRNDFSVILLHDKNKRNARKEKECIYFAANSIIIFVRLCAYSLFHYSLQSLLNVFVYLVSLLLSDLPKSEMLENIFCDVLLFLFFDHFISFVLVRFFIRFRCATLISKSINLWKIVDKKLQWFFLCICVCVCVCWRKRKYGRNEKESLVIVRQQKSNDLRCSMHKLQANIKYSSWFHTSWTQT